MKVNVRQATMDDALDVLNWRNDAETRRNSFESGIVNKEAHIRWFQSAIENPSRMMLIGFTPGTKVGICRFDIESYDNNESEVSINIAPQMRAKGVGKKLLVAAIDAYREVYDARIFAEIKPQNTASIQLFKSVGFEKIDASETMIVYCLVV